MICGIIISIRVDNHHTAHMNIDSGFDVPCTILVLYKFINLLKRKNDLISTTSELITDKTYYITMIYDTKKNVSSITSGVSQSLAISLLDGAITQLQNKIFCL